MRSPCNSRRLGFLAIFLASALVCLLYTLSTTSFFSTPRIQAQANDRVSNHLDHDAPILPQSATPPWCSSITLSSVFSDDMLLQQDARAAVYGVVRPQTQSDAVGLSSSHVVRVDVLDIHGKLMQSSSTSIVRSSSKNGQEWKVLLAPQTSGLGFTIVASCVHVDSKPTYELLSVVGTSTSIQRVAFGDLFLCVGQSNMALYLKATFGVARTLETLKSTSVAQRDRLRLMRYGGMSERYSSVAPIYVDLQKRRAWFNISQALVQPDYLMAASPPGDHFQQQQQQQQRVGGEVESKIFITEFSGACLQYGLALLEKLGPNAPPLGLVQSSVGGTMIEEWMGVDETAKCSHTAPLIHHEVPGGLYGGMISPFVNMTVRGWVYYQGENNVGATSGNSATMSGYGCEMMTLIDSWRKIWSVEAETTSKTAPFGIVTLASGTDEGSQSKMAGFRWSQTANYGVAPNPRMPNVFIAQAYDLGDPWPRQDLCAKNKCCLPHLANTREAASMHPIIKFLRGSSNNNIDRNSNEAKCMEPDSSWESEDWYNRPDVAALWGAIHPRLKVPVGQRLALGAMALSYGSKSEPFTGPTIKRCGLRSEKHREVLDIVFDMEMLMGDTIEFTLDERLNEGATEVNMYNVGLCFGPEDVCGCMEWESSFDKEKGQKIWTCVLHALPEFQNKIFEAKNIEWNNKMAASMRDEKTGFVGENNLVTDHWVIGVVKPGDVGAVTISVDLNASINSHYLKRGNGVVPSLSDLKAVRYGWGLDHYEDTCCGSPLVKQGLAPCPPNSCPLRTRGNKLPANPFFAMIEVNGQCKCPHPQVCHE